MTREEADERIAGLKVLMDLHKIDKPAEILSEEETVLFLILCETDETEAIIHAACIGEAIVGEHLYGG